MYLFFYNFFLHTFWNSGEIVCQNTRVLYLIHFFLCASLSLLSAQIFVCLSFDVRRSHQPTEPPLPSAPFPNPRPNNNKNRTRYTRNRLHRNAMEGGDAAGERERLREGGKQSDVGGLFRFTSVPRLRQYFACLHTKYHICWDCFIKKSKAGGANIFLAAAAQVELPFGYASTCLALAPERKHRHWYTYICSTHACAIKWSYYRKKR